VDRSYSTAAADRSYNSAAADRSYANAAPERAYSTASDRGHGGYGPSDGASHSGGHHGGNGGNWQQPQRHDKQSPRSSVSAGYEPDTPGRDGREEPPRLARFGGGGNNGGEPGSGGGLRRGPYGKLAPWDRTSSSGASSLDSGLLDARA